jgi:hypothetical protein
MNTYHKGQKVRCSVEFAVSTVLTDPTAVVFIIRQPDETQTTYTYGGVDGVIIKDSTGKYHADISTTQAGDWLMRWEGTGECNAVDEDIFFTETLFK